ncbi:sulfite exporter TauE/SafE family protein [Desulfuromonas versatilis]|nr:sulfite exporter TauE/SafE family protein [Desulfuromonas versatilis]
MHLLTLPIITLLVLLGSLAGFLAGLLGIGGGIILVPLFLWVFSTAGFHPEVIVHLAFGTSLAIILPTAISSTLGHRKRGNVDWHQVLYLSIGAALGAVAGASAAAGLSGEWLKVAFGAMQILVALKMYFLHPHLPPERGNQVPVYALLLVGLTGGAFSAFFGVGGGVIAVPLMVIVLQLPIHLAVGNSSALIVVSAFTGALSYTLHGLGNAQLPPYSLGYVNVLVAFLVAPFTILLARLGVRVAGRVSNDRLRYIFAAVLLIIGLRMIVKNLYF